MAGVRFTFENFKSLLDLKIGISQRLDENRAESFTLLYCDFESVYTQTIDDSLSTVLRSSDSIVNYDTDYFFVLPYTDKYGAEVVKQIFEDIFEKDIANFMVSYPVDGETSSELLEMLQDSVSTFLKKDLDYLERFFDSKEENL
jgi:predicted phosphoadenosine phosphosulfate sulfurtransferase